MLCQKCRQKAVYVYYIHVFKGIYMSNKSSEKDKIVEFLKDMGLSNNEAVVYKASLVLGPGTIQKIAITAGLKRTTVYSVIDQLKSKGLIQETYDGLKKKFAAQDPEYLESLLEQRKKELQDLIPQLTAMRANRGDQAVIKFYEGLESVKSVYESLIRDIKPYQDYMIIADQAKWLLLDEKWFRGFTEKRAKLNIRIRALFTDSPITQEWVKKQKNFNMEVKILPKEMNITTDTVITPQKYWIHDLHTPTFGMVITNKSIISTQQQLFEILWASVK